MESIILFIYLTSILFSAVMAFIYRKGIESRQLTILLPFLTLVFIQEVGLNIFERLGYITSNAVMYNIYRPVSAIVFAYMYYKIPFMKSLRKLIAGAITVYIVITLINYCFIEPISKTSSYVILARGSVITFFAVLFLFTYFNLDNHTEEKYWHPVVWVTIGIVIFYPVISISANFQKYLAANGMTLYGQKIYRTIPQVMSIFMYSCFSYAFYLCRKTN